MTTMTIKLMKTVAELIAEVLSEVLTSITAMDNDAVLVSMAFP